MGQEQNNQHKQRRARLRLPFDNRREDPVSWIYDNRVGLCVTIIVYLVLSIVFVSAKIGTSKRAVDETIYIDLGAVELVSEELERLKEEVRRNNQNIDWNSIRNLSSNENALNENLEDEKGTNTSALNASAEATERTERHTSAVCARLMPSERVVKRAKVTRSAKIPNARAVLRLVSRSQIPYDIVATW